jgi:predicted ribosome quality control (RQC) complex YloA/Tae2 family protein
MKTIVRRIDCIKADIEFIVGTTAQENHDIIDAADPSDLWFHVTEHPSCHVIGKISEIDGLDKKAINKIAVQGAVICKEYSNMKSQKKLSIDYTTISCVTKLEKPGSVSLSSHKVITI